MGLEQFRLFLHVFVENVRTRSAERKTKKLRQKIVVLIYPLLNLQLLLPLRTLSAVPPLLVVHILMQTSD